MKKIFGAAIFALSAGASLNASAVSYTQVLPVDTKLQKGDTLTSMNGNYNLVMQDDGNLVMYYLDANRTRATARHFSTGTRSRGSYAVVQYDGNFAVYDGSNKWAWQAGTGGKPAASYVLVLTDDGSLFLAGPPTSSQKWGGAYKTFNTDYCQAYVATAWYPAVSWDTNQEIPPVMANCGIDAVNFAAQKRAILKGNRPNRW